jgi:hypothetical protein
MWTWRSNLDEAGLTLTDRLKLKHAGQLKHVGQLKLKLKAQTQTTVYSFSKINSQID